MSILSMLTPEFREDVDAALRLESSAAKPTLEGLAFQVERAMTARDVHAIWRDARDLAPDGSNARVSDQAEVAEGRAAAYLAARLPSGVAGALVAEIGLSWPAFTGHLDSLGIAVSRPALAVVAEHVDEAHRWFAGRLRAPLKGGE